MPVNVLLNTMKLARKNNSISLLLRGLHIPGSEPEVSCLDDGFCLLGFPNIYMRMQRQAFNN